MKPNLVNEGPMARMMTCFGTAPVMVKPPMPTLFPVSVRMRVDRFNACAAGVAVGVAVGVGAFTTLDSLASLHAVETAGVFASPL